MQYNIDTGTFQVVMESADINAVVDESARIDVGEAINYIKTGQAEIGEAVQEGIASFDSNASQKTTAYNTNADNRLSEYNSNADNKLEAYNNNATSKTSAYNDNASEKLTTYNQNDTSKTSAYNTNAQNKLDAYNANDVAKTGAYNQNASDKVDAFNSNATAKTGAFNDNATSKTTDFNTNATNKTTAFNNNATSKTEAFDLNASNKTTDFNDNYTTKKVLIDAQLGVAEGAATTATTQAGLAKQWAIGDPSEPTGNSAKYWAEQASSELSGLTSRVSTIEGEIPSAASSSNQLADKSYVDTADSGLQTQINAKYDASNPSGYQANVIETIKVNGTALTPSSKAVDITVPAAQVNSDWNASSGIAEILNKPSLATVATSGSYNDLSNTPTIPTVDQTYSASSANAQSGTAVASAVSGKQDTLVSGTNIKTINNTSILGSGNLTTSAQWGGITGTLSDQTDLNNALSAKANDADVVKLTGNQTIAGTKTFSSAIKVGTAGGTAKGALINTDGSIELISASTSNNGGYIDFHYNGSTSDYTSRIIESANGKLRLQCTTTQAPTPTEDTTSSTQIDTVGARNTKLANYALDNSVVKLTGNQTIAGTKTFSASPLVPTPATSDNSTKIATTAFVNNKLNSTFSDRCIGQIVTSTVPLSDAGLHLLDGSLIQGSGSYSAFVTHIAGLVSSYPDLFETEANWQTAVTTYGVCGKFVYDSVNNTVRLPKITGFVEGTTDVTALGDLVEAGLPNIKGTGFGRNNSENPTGACISRATSYTNFGSGSGYISDFDASRSSSIYGNSNTVQPQAIKVLYYIVIATSTKTQIEVDIDEIATDLNGKANVDLSNCTAVHIVETWHSGTEWYRIWSDGWIEQGGVFTWSGNGQQGPISLYKNYADTNYNVYLQCRGTAENATTNDVAVRTQQTSNFYITAYTDNRNIYWEVKGMGA